MQQGICVCIAHVIVDIFLAVRARLNWMQCNFWITNIATLVLEQWRTCKQRAILHVIAATQIALLERLFECAYGNGMYILQLDSCRSR